MKRFECRMACEYYIEVEAETPEEAETKADSILDSEWAWTWSGIDVEEIGGQDEDPNTT